MHVPRPSRRSSKSSCLGQMVPCDTKPLLRVTGSCVASMCLNFCPEESIKTSVRMYAQSASKTCKWAKMLHRSSASICFTQSAFAPGFHREYAKVLLAVAPIAITKYALPSSVRRMQTWLPLEFTAHSHGSLCRLHRHYRTPSLPWLSDATPLSRPES